MRDISEHWNGNRIAFPCVWKFAFPAFHRNKISMFNNNLTF